MEKVELKIFNGIPQMQQQAMLLNRIAFTHWNRDEFDVIVISNKRYPFELHIKSTETVLDIKQTIQKITNIDTKLQNIYCMINPHAYTFKEVKNNQYYKPGDVTSSAVDCPVPKLIAVCFKEFLNLTIKFYENMYDLSHFKQQTFEHEETNCLIKPLTKITDGKYILESLICKKYDATEDLLIYGYLRYDNKQPIFPAEITHIIIQFYENENNIVNMFASVKHNKISHDCSKLILYKNVTKKYVKWEELKANDVYNICITDYQTRNVYTLQVTKKSTIVDVRMAFCGKSDHHKWRLQSHSWTMRDNEKVPYYDRVDQITLIYGNYIIARGRWNNNDQLITHKIGPGAMITVDSKPISATYY